MNYVGSCHCGDLRFEAEGVIESAMECNCSHCSRKGYLLWFMPRAQLKWSAAEGSMSTYTFNKHVIQHQFCKRCGCAPFGFGVMPNGAEMAAVNIRCIEGLDVSSIGKIAVDGRSL